MPASREIIATKPSSFARRSNSPFLYPFRQDIRSEDLMPRQEMPQIEREIFVQQDFHFFAGIAG
jgi:hypothetical protein